MRKPNDLSRRRTQGRRDDLGSAKIGEGEATQNQRERISFDRHSYSR